MLSLMCSNRFDPAWQPIVSSMNQLIPLPIEVPPEATLGAFLKRTNIKALLAYRHGCHDVDEAAGLIAQRRGPDGQTLEHDCWFNYVSEPEDTGAPAPDPVTGRPATLDWEPPPRNAGHPFYVRVNGDARTWLAVSLRTDPDLIGPAGLVGVLRTIVLGAQRLGTEPESTLGALRADRDSAPLAPGLFPGPADQAVVAVTSQESGAT
jgi:hypothetical protein